LGMDNHGIRFGKRNGQTALMFTVSENKQVNTYIDRWVDGSYEFMYDGCKAKRTNEKVCEYWRSHGNYAPIVLGVGLRQYRLDDCKYARGHSLEWVVFEEGLNIKDIQYINGKIKFIIKIECSHIIRDLSYITRRWGSEIRVPPPVTSSPSQVNDDTADEWDFIKRFNGLSTCGKEKFREVIELPFVRDLLRLYVPGYIDL